MVNNFFDNFLSNLQMSEQTSEQIEKNLEKRGRKTKYATNEDRIVARRLQQKAYRERKKDEIETLKNIIKDLEAQLAHYKEEEKESLDETE